VGSSCYAGGIRWQYTQEQYDEWFLPERGGEQGDYREGMPEKIANVIDCLKNEPLSKRAIIPIPFNSEGSETVDWRNQVTGGTRWMSAFDRVVSTTSPMCELWWLCGWMRGWVRRVWWR